MSELVMKIYQRGPPDDWLVASRFVGHVSSEAVMMRRQVGQQM
jgi:hypothetical protein